MGFSTNGSPAPMPGIFVLPSLNRFIRESLCSSVSRACWTCGVVVFKLSGSILRSLGAAAGITLTTSGLAPSPTEPGLSKLMILACSSACCASKVFSSAAKTAALVTESTVDCIVAALVPNGGGAEAVAGTIGGRRAEPGA